MSFCFDVLEQAQSNNEEKNYDPNR